MQREEDCETSRTRWSGGCRGDWIFLGWAFFPTTISEASRNRPHCEKRRGPEGMAYPEDLLEDAKNVLAASGKQPRQSLLRRAVSTAYCSAFHLLVADFV